ncbi:hypothetical protein GQ607_016956 [Colletotrichum asianum]|uniref:Uncharacterized protein n=1 Tax=Colletotrichum asianum TaxID=702518 RepID=A0A8H3VY14_9PEZI|nr:hypothetical protein GQ607_016956 [Colletotrichum asianum]
MTLCPRPVRRHGIGMGHVSVEQPIPIPAARTSQIKRSWGHPSGSQNRLENGGLGGARSTSRPPSRLVGAVDQRQPASLSGEVDGPVAPGEDPASAAISRRQPPTRTSWPCRQGLRQAAYILWFSPSNSSSERWLSAMCLFAIRLCHGSAQRGKTCQALLEGRPLRRHAGIPFPPCLPRESKVRPEVLLQRARLGNLSAGSLEAVGKGLSRFAAAAAAAQCLLAIHCVFLCGSRRTADKWESSEFPHSNTTRADCG